MDTVAGVYFPTGGMHALPTALAGAATKHGVDLRLGTEVVEVERREGRAVAVRTSEDERVECDALILTADLPIAWSALLNETPRRVRRLRYSPSCVFLLAGSRTAFPDRVHHEIDFGASWDATFDEIIDRGQVMSDPSFMVSIPSRTDPTLAPTGRHCMSVLFPAPNLTMRQQDWTTMGPAYRDHMLATLEARGWPGFTAALEVSEMATPADWAARGMAAGTPFAAAHTLGQTGPFRPRNLAGGWENVVLAGSGTTPGVGVPSVLISGRLAAERITGPDRRYRSRAWPS
jgi:phytoene desaturase